MTDNLLNFSKAVREKMLAGDDARLMLLKNQLSHMDVTTFKHTGCGFYVYYCVSVDNFDLSSKSHFCIDDVEAALEDEGKLSIDCVLHINNGKIWFFEATVLGIENECPKTIDKYVLKYRNDNQRELDFP